MNFIKSINLSFKEYKNSFFQYKLTFFTSILLAVFCILDICWNGKDFSHKLIKSAHCGLLISAVASYSEIFLTQRMSCILKKTIQLLCSFLIFSITFTSYYFSQKNYSTLYLWGIGLSIVCFTVFIFSQNSFHAIYANILKYFFFTELLCGIILLGLILLTGAFCTLLIKINNTSRIYEIIMTLCLEVFSVNIFSYFLFHKIRKNDSGNAMKIIFVYILLPVFTFLVLLLYAYLIKSAFIRKMPKGQINYFVSFATAFYLLFYFVLKEHKKIKFIRRFYAYSHYFLIPLIIIQIFAFFIRLKAYGLTEFRHASFLYIIFSLITVCAAFIQNGKCIKYAPLVLAGFILYGTVSPWNIINSSWKNQYERLSKILTEYDLLEDDKIINTSDLKEKIKTDDAIILYDSWIYLEKKSHKQAPAYVDGKDFSETFNIEIPHKSENSANYYSYYTTSIEYNVSGYKTMKQLNEYVEPHGTIVILAGKYDITSYLLHLTENPAKYAENPPPFIPDENTKIFFQRIHFDFQKENQIFNYVSVDGYELIK